MGRLLVYVMLMLGFCEPIQSQCPSIPQCECTSWSQTVSCSSVGSTLVTILQNIPTTTRSLKLAGVYSIKEQDTDQTSRILIDELSITESQIQEISNNAFKHFPLLRKLHLNQNQIYSIASEAFAGIGNLQTLDLSRNRLASIINTNIFKPVFYLRELDLSHNQLSEISTGLLDPLKSLKILSITGNRISSLTGSAFSGVPGLQKLYASQSGIRSIDDEFFTKATMMETLDLSHNSLSAVPGNGQLNQLQHLRNLTLQGNVISQLPDGVFQGLNLDVLDLSKNKIANLQQNTFMYLGSVRYLDLSSNEIFRLPDYVFQPISSQLYSLKLNTNKRLSSLPANLLNGMQMLQDLNLSSCSLNHLPETFLANIFTLQRIDVSNNMLTSLPESFLLKANQLTHVRISNNPWICDCLIKPLRDWLRFPRSTEVIYCIDNTPAGFNRNCAAPKCMSPQKLLYRDIYTLQDQEIPTCEKFDESASAPVTIIIGVVAGVVVCLIIIIIIIICAYRRHRDGEPLLCGSNNKKTRHKRRKKDPISEYYREKKEKRQLDPDAGSLSESDKGFVVRNYFHSMDPDNDEASMVTQSMTKRGSQESLSHSGYAYGSRAGSRNSSQYSLNSGYRIESAV